MEAAVQKGRERKQNSTYPDLQQGHNPTITSIPHVSYVNKHLPQSLKWLFTNK